MQLDQLTARLRPRTAFEASDLGLGLLRRYAGPVYAVWFTVTVPLHLLLITSLSPRLAIVVAWWLRPLFDLFVLHVLSRALFGAAPTLRQTLAATPTFLPIAINRLTWKRLDPLRAYALPAELLEGLSGTAKSRRLSYLRTKAGNGDLGLIFVASLLELCAWLGLIGAATMALPESWLDYAPVRGLEGENGEQVLVPQPTWLGYGLFVVMWLATSLIEPAYVAAGFGQYLNRRTLTEAWDLELGLRRLADRARRLRTPALVLLLGWLCAGRPAAQEPSESPKSDPARVIAEVLAEPEFTHTRQRRKRGDKEMPSRDQGVLGGILDLLAIGTVVLLAGTVLWFAWQSRADGPAQTAPVAPARPRSVAGFDLANADLPADIPAAAAALFAQGDTRAGLSLLYRGGLLQLVDGWQLRIRDSATEGDCQRAAESLPAAARAYFAALSTAWVHAAYGHAPPSAQTAADLCRNWSSMLAPESRRGEP